MSGHIRALRMKCRLRQRDVAAELGITDHQIRKWERGLAVPPPPVIRALAKLFGVSPSNLERAQIFLRRFGGSRRRVHYCVALLIRD